MNFVPVEKGKAMTDRKDCAHYADCNYRNDIGYCAYYCLKYRHRDEIRVVRCKDCKHWRNSGKNMFGSDYGTCVECLMDTKEDFFCGFGEREKQ